MSAPEPAAGPVAAVFVKHVPRGERPVRVEGDRVRREDAVMGPDAANLVPLEWAVQAAEAGTLARVVAVTMGPPTAVEALRHACAAGAHEGLHVCDPLLAGADVRATARVLAATVERLGASLALFGYESSDAASGVVPGAVAARLRRPLLSRVGAAALEGDATRVVAEADLGHGLERLETAAPAVLSFVEGRIVPRHPKVKDVLRLRKATFPTLSLGELGVAVGQDRGAERVARVVRLPEAPKEPTVLGLDDGVRALGELLLGTPVGG